MSICLGLKDFKSLYGKRFISGDRPGSSRADSAQCPRPGTPEQRGPRERGGPGCMLGLAPGGQPHGLSPLSARRRPGWTGAAEGAGGWRGSDHASEARGAGLRVAATSPRWLRLTEREARGGWGSKHPSRGGGVGATLLTAGVRALLAGTCRPADKGWQEECPCHRQAHCPIC